VNMSYCNFCRKVTEESGGVCTVCGLSKPYKKDTFQVDDVVFIRARVVSVSNNPNAKRPVELLTEDEGALFHYCTQEGRFGNELEPTVILAGRSK